MHAIPRCAALAHGAKPGGLHGAIIDRASGSECGIDGATWTLMTSKTKTMAAKPSMKKTPTKKGHALRRDATGHLDAAYAADLHAKSLATAEDHTVDRAFLRPSKTLRAPLGDELGREVVMTMTSAEDQSDQLQDVELDRGEELGGPFVVTTAAQEFAGGSDRSNPRGATREPFPKT